MWKLAYTTEEQARNHIWRGLGRKGRWTHASATRRAEIPGLIVQADAVKLSFQPCTVYGIAIGYRLRDCRRIRNACSSPTATVHRSYFLETDPDVACQMWCVKWSSSCWSGTMSRQRRRSSTEAVPGQFFQYTITQYPSGEQQSILEPNALVMGYAFPP